MARINTAGQLSVGTTAGAGQSVNGLTGGGNTQTNISTKEATYMGGNPARVNAAGAVCMPNQAQRTINLANFAGNAVSYNNSQAVAWRQTALSEFRGAYTTRPTATFSIAGTGTTNIGRVTITVTPPPDDPRVCAVYLTGTAGWANTNASNQISYDITRNQTYTAYIKDINNCGANMEFSITGIIYTG